MPLTLLLALILLIGYIIYFRATLRSIGTFGMALVAAVFAALIWVLVDFGVLSLKNSDLNMWHPGIISGARDRSFVVLRAPRHHRLVRR